MKTTVALLLLAFTLPACSFSKQSRQQRAYQKYVRKSSLARGKQQSKFRTGETRMPTTPMPSEPMESTTSGPESMPSENPE